MFVKKLPLMAIEVFGVLVVAGMTALEAHKGATGVVKERMDQMGEIAKSMKAMGAMFKGATPYDAEAVRGKGSSQSLAAKLGDLSRQRHVSHWDRELCQRSQRVVHDALGAKRISRRGHVHWIWPAHSTGTDIWLVFL